MYVQPWRGPPLFVHQFSAQERQKLYTLEDPSKASKSKCKYKRGRAFARASSLMGHATPNTSLYPELALKYTWAVTCTRTCL